VPSLTHASFVKICGITSIDDARAVADNGGDAIGLILAESSRQLTVDAARDIADAMKGAVLRVAVFRHNAPEFILASVDATGVDLAQVHGELPDDLVSELRRLGVDVVKALSTTEDAFHSFDETLVDAVLIDGPAPGSGEVHGWPDLTRRGFRRPVIAAGGLTPSNVATVIDSTGAWGVDVSSGVERSPGVKDPALVRDFIVNARVRFTQRRERGG
jgi:phosphoribosylanthranilate isomerase